MESYPIIEAGGENRILCLKPRRLAVGDLACCHAVMGVGSGPEIIPRSTWPTDGVDLSPEVAEILDQDGLSLCHSFAGTQVNEIAHRLAGHRGLKLSAGNLAGQVTGNQDQGAGVDEVLAVLIKSGQTTRATIGQNDYEGRDWPSGWKDEAAKYRVAKAYDCGHDHVFDAIVTCLLLGWPVELGTMAFGGGHAITATRFYKLNGVWRLRGPNSWGSGWTNCDKAGYWDFPEQKISNGMEDFGAFGIQAAVVNPDDKLPEVA
jgi:hypothetical protein